MGKFTFGIVLVVIESVFVTNYDAHVIFCHYVNAKVVFVDLIS